MGNDDSKIARLWSGLRAGGLQALRLSWLIVLVAVGARAETVAVFDNSLYVDTGGTASDESDTVQATLAFLGHTVVTFTGITAADWTAAGAGADLILIPELELRDLNSDLTPEARTAIADYVDGGGGLIMMNSSGRDTALLNAVFGFSLSYTSGLTTVLDPVDAEGTPFEGGPPSLGTPSYTISIYISSLPAETLDFYEASGRTSVFATEVGLGRVGYMGWDWYNAYPLGTQDGGWVQVLGSMVTHVSGVVIADIDASGLFPLNLFGLEDSTIANPLGFELSSAGLEGRSEAFDLEMTLTDGQFAALPTFGSAGSGADIESGPALHTGTPDEWTVALISGGLGAPSLRYAVTPPASAVPVDSGAMFTVRAGGISVNALNQSLAAEGQMLGLAIRSLEPGADSRLQQLGVLLAESIDGVLFDGEDHTASGRFEGTEFVRRSQDFTIGATGVCTGFPTPSGFPPSANCSGEDLFQFDPVNDTIAIRVGGADLPAVLAAPGYRLAVHAGPGCDRAGEIVSFSGPLPSGQSSVDLSFAPAAPDETSFALCVITDRSTQVMRSLAVEVRVDFASIFLVESPPHHLDLDLAPRCFGDLNADGLVNNSDLYRFRACFPCTGPGCDIACDANFDGNVNNADILELRKTFGSVCPGF